MELGRSIKAIWYKMVRQKHTPEEIASGVAVGLFLAFAAPPGLQLLPAILITKLLGYSVLAASFSVFVTNPFTMPLIYPLAAYLGAWITGIPLHDSVPTSDESFWKYATNPAIHGRVLVFISVGCFLMGLVSATTGYYLVRFWVYKHRKMKQINGFDTSKND